MEHNKLVYIASPYSGDVERNVAFAKAACRYAMNQGVTPIASHLLYPQMLDDGVPEERFPHPGTGILSFSRNI